MATQTHKTAIVWVPPEDVWEPIQAIRREHDRQFRRWMPHVTLIYPFRPRAAFDRLAGRLGEAVAGVEPFETELAEFRWFKHSRDSFTVWLAPEPAEPLARLQNALQSVAADCDAVRRFVTGFTPHLSVGQTRDSGRLEGLVAALQADWAPLRCRVERIALLWRNDPPDDVFRVDRQLALGPTGGPPAGA